MVVLTPRVTLLAHPINTKAHPTVPPGFRWAVMLGDGPDHDPSRCAEARWCPTEHEAWFEGEMVTVAVVKALRAFGIRAEASRRWLDHDPVPANDNAVAIGA